MDLGLPIKPITGGYTFVAMNGQNLGVVGSAEVLHLVTNSNEVTRNGKDTFVVGLLADYDVNPTPNFRRKTLH